MSARPTAPPHSGGVLTGFAILGAGAIVFIAVSLLWHAPRCTGPRPSDVCPIGGVSHGHNTYPNGNQR